MECPMCGLDLSTWPIPDREAHADGCLESAPGADAAVGAERTAGVGVPSPSPGCQPRWRREPEPVAGDWTEEAELRGDIDVSVPSSAPADGDGTRGDDGMTDAERHDDDWLRLAMAMSASMADARQARVMATSGDYGWMPASSAARAGGGNAQVRRGGRCDGARSAAAEPEREIYGGAPPVSTGEPLTDTTDVDPGPSEASAISAAGGEPTVDARQMPRAIRFAIRKGRRERLDEDEDEDDDLGAGVDATQRTRRRILAPMWSMAGHGGHDAPMPDSLLALCLRR